MQQFNCNIDFKMDELDLQLQEVDSLEAIVIVDNELDPMSPPAPDTVQVLGNLGHIAMRNDSNLTDRGGASKEMRMEDICCSAHGLSILVVCYAHPLRIVIYRLYPTNIISDGHKGRDETLSPIRCWSRRRCLGTQYQSITSESFFH